MVPFSLAFSLWSLQGNVLESILQILQISSLHELTVRAERPTRRAYRDVWGFVLPEEIEPVTMQGNKNRKE